MKLRSKNRSSVLFVCMGNICRSPTAEAVFRKTIAVADGAGAFDCDSAGTHNYHIGDAPDPRTITAAKRRGYDMDSLRARQVEIEDFSRFDLVLAMDRDNLAALQRLCPPLLRARVMLYGDMHDDYAGQDVPDPYYGGPAGFERVLNMAEAISPRLLEFLRTGAAGGQETGRCGRPVI
jgi:protein-tyrosine phosphatase